jgi:thymidylate kinase
VSFSGIDGAGKTTQINYLCEHLRKDGISFHVVSFWDQVATLKLVREFSSHALFKGDQGVGTPDRPLNRRDKNVESWYMTAVRLFLYLLDALSLHRAVAKLRRCDADVALFDRYIYDELANLSSHRAVRTYMRVLLRITPRPEIAFLLDADPAKARERKPEYPLDFLDRSRASYLALSRSVPMTVVFPSSPAEVAARIAQGVSAKLAPMATREALSVASGTRDES